MSNYSDSRPDDIQEAVQGHYKDILELFSDPDELFYIYPKGRHPFSLEQLQIIVESRSDLTVVLDGERVIGFANLYNYQPESWVFIGNLVVGKDYRSRGIGRKLIDHMEGLAKSKYRLPEVRISVFNSNTPALLLYSALGYTPYDVEQRETPAGEAVALIHMRKRFHKET